MDTEDNNQKKILQSQGVRLTHPESALRPRNRIEAAISKASGEPFLPPLKEKVADIPVPLPVIKPQKEIPKEIPIVKQVEVIKPVKPRKPFPIKKIKIILRVGLFVLVCALVLSGIGFVGYKGVRLILAQFSSSTDDSGILGAVGKLVTLPVGEDPTILTVTNLEALKNQAFFADAKIGDKVLIFSKSKKAVLYRPSENRVVVMAPLNN